MEPISYNRRRFQDDRIAGSVVNDTYSCPIPGQGVNAVSVVLPFVRGSYRLMDDTYTPLFRTKDKKRRGHTRNGYLRPKPIKQLRIKLHDLAYWKETRESNEINVWVGGPGRTCLNCTIPWCGTEWRGSFAAHVGTDHEPQLWQPVLFQTRLQNSLDNCLVRALAKANTSSVMTGEFIGTIGQSLKMFAHPFSSFENAIDLALKPVRPDHVRAFQGITKLLKEQNRVFREKVKRGLSPTAAISAAWLELRYGWLPILADLKTILVELDNKRAKLLSSVIVARSKDAFTFKGDRALDPLKLGNRYPVSRRGTYDISMETRAGVAYQLHLADNTQYIQRFLGLRLRDIPGVAWELVPWSFVVDWFIHIGDYLEAYVPACDLKILDYWYSYKGKFTYQTFFEGFGTVGFPSGYVTECSEIPYYRIEYENKYRKINPALPWTPQLDMDFLSTLQSLDALALLIAKAFKTIPKMVSR